MHLTTTTTALNLMANGGKISDGPKVQRRSAGCHRGARQTEQSNDKERGPSNDC